VKVFGKDIEIGKIQVDSEKISGNIEIKKIDKGILVEGKISSSDSRVEVARFKAPENLIFNNWQSWGPTMLVPLQFMSKSMWKVLRSQMNNKIEYNLSPLIEEWYESPISDYFIGYKNGLVGFLTSNKAHPFFVLEGEEIVVYLEYFITEEEEKEIEPFVILENDEVENLMENYAEIIRDFHNPKIIEKVPVGWCSWYNYFTDFKWEEMNKNLELANEFSYDVFQIDDSFQDDIGDWFTPGNDFPSTAIIADKINSYGYTAGLWTAPFSISETSEIYVNNPEWLVKDESGNPKVCYHNWDKNIYSLDVTNPQAAEWLEYVFKRLKEEGYDYFKIDFLFAGAMPGKRFKNVSPISAYIEGMKIIRKSVGDESFILGCGAPLLPSIGIVDGMRIGPDTSPDWGADRPMFDGSPNAHFALQNTLFRQFMHKKFWLNDPDCIMLRDKGISQTQEEREIFSITCGLLDNMILQSDDLGLVEEEGKKLFKDTVSKLGGKSRVKNLFSGNELYIIEREKNNIVEKYVLNIGENEIEYEDILVKPKTYTKL